MDLLVNGPGTPANDLWRQYWAKDGKQTEPEDIFFEGTTGEIFCADGVVNETITKLLNEELLVCLDTLVFVPTNEQRGLATGMDFHVYGDSMCSLKKGGKKGGHVIPRASFEGLQNAFLNIICVVALNECLDVDESGVA